MRGVLYLKLGLGLKDKRMDGNAMNNVGESSYSFNFKKWLF